MLHRWGTPTQLGYVIADLDEAMGHWIRTLGVGPFFVFDVGVDDYRLRGQTQAGPIGATIALANVGSLQIELIEPHGDGPSLWHEFLAANPAGGLQHLSWWPDDYGAAVADAAAAGWRVGHDGVIGGGRFAYYDMAPPGHPGTVIEIAEMIPSRRHLFEVVRKAAEGWDGSTDPIRPR